MNTDEIVSKLQGVKTVPDGWMARCPAHEDRTQSLHVSTGDSGRTLLKCFAGCETKSILDRMGLKMADLFARSNGNASEKHKSAFTIVAKYDYYDERGNRLFQVVRKNPKGFFQRRPDDKGGWIPNMNGVRKVLYRLPELVKSDKSQPVLLVEGEKDVDTAYSLRFTATTSPMGAGKWRDEYSESLRDRHVILVPDNDTSGVSHMKEIAKSLEHRAATIRWLELPGLPPKGDLSDWVLAGGTREGLLEHVADARLATPAMLEDDDDDETPAQDELRDRWIEKHPLTAYGLSEYKRYANGVWNRVPDDVIKREISDVLEDAKGEHIKLSTTILNSVVELARIKIFVSDEVWNSNPDILVATNGTLCISTRILREHSPEDYQTIGLPYPYDPTATSPVWGHFLNSTIPESAKLFQEFAGYALTTETKYEISIWFVGERGSGKSTGVAGLEAMLGDKIGYLGLAEIERSQFALSNLPGKTLVVATEQPYMFLHATHIVNKIISGENVNVEAKFKNSYTFKSNVKVLWAMNNLPRIPNADDGLFRRVKVIKFPPIAPKDRDPEIKRAIEGDGAAILNWALDGLDRLVKRGRFEIPVEVQIATDSFQVNNDVPLHFVEEQCVTGADHKVQSSVLYSAYKFWCDANGHHAQSSTSMASEWTRLNFEKYMSNGKVFYRGVALATNIS